MCLCEGWVGHEASSLTLQFSGPATPILKQYADHCIFRYLNLHHHVVGIQKANPAKSEKKKETEG